MRAPFVRCGSNVGWMPNGTPRSCAAANARIVRRVPERAGVVGEQRDMRAALADGALEFAYCSFRVAQRQMRGQDQSWIAGTELTDPAVVRRV